MTPHAPLPADLRHWVTHRLPGLTDVTDVSWPRNNSQVWRVASGTKEAYVKISPTAGDFAREVHAYQHAAHCLTPDEAPRLLAADPGLRAIMTSPLPGLVVKDLPLPAELESQVHELAGRLLRRWHDHDFSSAPESVRDDAVTSVVQQAGEAAARLEHTAQHLTDTQHAMAQQACQELPQLAECLPLAFRHGDYAPRNWLWVPDSGALGLLDFEKSLYGIAIEDLVWLFATTWPTRPDLKTAFLTGYGRQFSDVERRALPLFTALAAVSYLDAGITQQQSVLVERARTALQHLVVASS